MMHGARVYEFGDFDQPTYSALLHAAVPGGERGEFNYWCCLHKHDKPQAAANHAAQLMAAEWVAEEGQAPE